MGLIELDRPIAFHRVFVTITGSINAALFLSQANYWACRTKDPDGWFFKTGDEWQEETGLSRDERDGARKKLKSLGILEEKLTGVPARLHYRVIEAQTRQLLAEISQTSLRVSRKLDVAKPANLMRENPQTNTETTTETTTLSSFANEFAKQTKKPNSQKNRFAKENTIPDSWRKYCEEKRPGLNANEIYEEFSDHWLASAQSTASKMDWDAAFRTWVRKKFKTPVEIGDEQQRQRQKYML